MLLRIDDGGVLYPRKFRNKIEKEKNTFIVTKCWPMPRSNELVRTNSSNEEVGMKKVRMQRFEQFFEARFTLLLSSK